MSEQSLYDRLGGREAIRAVTDDFYDRVLADEDFAHFFEGTDTEQLRTAQTDFLCQATGGPAAYEGASIRDAHLELPITADHVEGVVDHLAASLDAAGVPEAEKTAVLEAVAQYEDALLATPDGA